MAIANAPLLTPSTLANGSVAILLFAAPPFRGCSINRRLCAAWLGAVARRCGSALVAIPRIRLTNGGMPRSTPSRDAGTPSNTASGEGREAGFEGQDGTRDVQEDGLQTSLGNTRNDNNGESAEGSTLAVFHSFT